MKVPATVAASIICFAAGVAVGVVAVVNFGSSWFASKAEAASPPAAGEARQGGPPRGTGGPPGRGDAPANRGPSAKNQLASLVAKLDQLTGKSLTLNLSSEQRTKLREQLDGLEGKDELAEEDAKKRLDAVLDVVKSEKETLEAAGYRWPGERGGQRPSDAPNPFKDEAAAKHLKTLQEQLAAKDK
jgi:hypothetical protein